MNLSQAKTKLNTYRKLEGKIVDGQEITFHIVPAVHNGANLLYEATIVFLTPLEDFYTGYNDFEVVVIYDYDQYPNTGYLIWKPATIFDEAQQGQ